MSLLYPFAYMTVLLLIYQGPGVRGMRVMCSVPSRRCCAFTDTLEAGGRKSGEEGVKGGRTTLASGLLLILDGRFCEHSLKTLRSLML